MIYELHKPSNNGTSSWLEWLDCPLKASLRRQAKSDPGAPPNWGSRPMQIGTVGHALLDCYHRGIYDTEIKFIDWENEPVDFGDGVVDEAIRVVNAYVDAHEIGHWGAVLGTEVTFDSDACSAAATGSPLRGWSGRADMICDGTLIDWKFVGRFGEAARARYSNSMQVRCYMLAARAAGYEIERGVIVLLSTTKEPRFEYVEIPFPSRREVVQIHATFEHIAKVRAERSHEANPNRCFDSYGSVCEFFDTCRRYHNG